MRSITNHAYLVQPRMNYKTCKLRGLIALCWGVFCSVANVMGQVDTEFWFVAPEVWANHGDSPTLLRFATFDNAAVITVEQPANSSFPTQTINVAANSVSSLNLAPWLAQVENKPANTILNFGIHITSTSLIQAYYEVNPSNNLNPDIFALKGENALGTQFYVPFQNYLQNAYTQSTASFDIVATEDSTVIEIIPRKPIVGHVANVPFTIVLNQGQTWSGRASWVQANQHPFGTVVTSNKPIAITMSDDSLQGTPYGGCADIMGDQIVPTSIVGTEYIAVKGNLNGPDKVFFIPTEPNTTISVNGNVVFTLNTLTSIYAHTLSANAAYYEASAPVYALHLTGFGCEVGGALLPPIVCTGSQEVAFIRSTNEFIGLKILVPSGGEDDFVFNGNATQITAGQFNDVPGTGGAWKYANITATTFVPQLAASRLSNSTSQFHLGIINGGASSGTRYGYFSNYAAQAYVVQVDDNSICEGDQLLLESNELIGATYDWTGPNGFSAQGNSIEFGVVDENDEGAYIISGFVGACPIENDTLNLLVYPNPAQPEIMGETEVCAGDSLHLETDTLDQVVYQWTGPNGFFPNNPVLSVAETTEEHDGLFTLIINDHGCYSPPTFWDVSVTPSDTAGIDADDFIICEGNPIILTSTDEPYESLIWTHPDGSIISVQNGFQMNNTNEDDSGWYVLNASMNDCPMVPDSVWVEVAPYPSIENVEAPSVCLGEQAEFSADADVANATINWFNEDGLFIGSGNPWVIPASDWDDVQTYAAVAEASGCESESYEFEFTVVPPQNLDIVDGNGNSLSNVQLCAGDNLTFYPEGPEETSWIWYDQTGDASNAPTQSIINADDSDEGWYVLTGYIENCPMIPDSILIDVLPTPDPPELTNFINVCEGSSWTLNASASTGSIQWYHPYWGNFDGSALVMDSVPLQAGGTYQVYAVVDGCPSSSMIANFEVTPLPNNILTDFGPILVERCPMNDPIIDLPEYDPMYSSTWTYVDENGNSQNFGSGAGMLAPYDGIYEVFLETGSPCNLSATGSFEVETIVCSLIIPNVISPNRDADNEAFVLPDLAYFPYSTCKIFNRWGQVVYSSQDFGKSAGWQPEESEATEGTYYYELFINRVDGDITILSEHGEKTYTEPGPILLIGNLTLVR